MATITLALSPQVKKFATGKPDGVSMYATAQIPGRLIPQDGAQFGKDEYNMDTLSLPFKIFSGSNWTKLLPNRGDKLSGLPNMVVWDPIQSITVGKAMVDLRVMMKGLIALNGVTNIWNSFANNPAPRDTIGIGQAQISGTDGSSVLDITFRRPQSVFKYVTTDDVVVPPSAVNNSDDPNRIPKIISFAVRGSSTVPDQGDDDADTGTATYVGFNLGVRERCITVDTVEVGNYYQNEATVVYEFYDTANPS